MEPISVSDIKFTCRPAFPKVRNGTEKNLYLHNIKKFHMSIGNDLPFSDQYGLTYPPWLLAYRISSGFPVNSAYEIHTAFSHEPQSHRILPV